MEQYLNKQDFIRKYDKKQFQELKEVLNKTDEQHPLSVFEICRKIGDNMAIRNEIAAKLRTLSTTKLRVFSPRKRFFSQLFSDVKVRKIIPSHYSKYYIENSISTTKIEKDFDNWNENKKYLQSYYRQEAKEYYLGLIAKILEILPTDKSKAKEITEIARELKIKKVNKIRNAIRLISMFGYADKTDNTIQYYQVKEGGKK